MRIHLTILLLLIAHLVSGQVVVEARSSAEKVVNGGYFEVSYTINTDKVSDFRPPKFKHFKRLGGGARSMHTSSINGRSTTRLTYRFQVQALKVGTFTIEPAFVDYKGEKIESKTLTIEVQEGKRGSDVSGDNSVVLAELQVSDSTIVIGQQLILNYILYFKRDISRPQFIKSPDYDGFFSVHTNEMAPVKKTVINGEEYYYKSIRTRALFPQRTGLFTFDPVDLNVEVVLPGQNTRRRRSIFSRLATENIVVTMPGVNVVVEDLPKPEPISFSGAVGKYRMAAKINKRNITTDDAILVQMEIRGNGDGKTTSAPMQPTMEHLEYYDPNVIDDKTIDEFGHYENYKLIEYMVVPKKPGTYDIKPEFTYYDTDSNDYVTLASGPYKIQVGQGSASITNDDREIYDISQLSSKRSHTSIVKNGQLSFMNNGLWASLGLFFCMLGGIYYKRRKIIEEENIDPLEKKKAEALKVINEKLAKARSLMNSGTDRTFYEEINNALNTFLQDKYAVPAVDFNQNGIKRHMSEQNVSDDLISEYIDILKLSELSIFAGVSSDKEQLLSRVSELMQRL